MRYMPAGAGIVIGASLGILVWIVLFWAFWLHSPGG